MKVILYLVLLFALRTVAWCDVRIHPPTHIKQYLRLSEALDLYRSLLEPERYSPPLSSIRPLRLGDRNGEVVNVRKRLISNGDLAPEEHSSDYFDEDLTQSVKKFQRRHGLTVDGIVGRRTVEELNVPIEKRIHTLLVNLERWASLPEALGESFLLVNIAGFELVVVNHGVPVFRTPVIVGKRYHKTPVFSSSLQYIELNPAWNVPQSIAQNEIIPKLQKNPRYLDSQHMRILSGAQEVGGTSNKPDPKRLRIVQDPGPWNALGALKFFFPNPYEVYLHDTPAKRLFDEPVRTFSHGCIRVSDPLRLAVTLLDGAWDIEGLTNLIDAKETIRIPLTNPIPVHVIYRTAWVDTDGSINFRNDVYGRD